MGGVRFLVAGSGLYAWMRFRGAPAPSRLEWRNAAIVGVLLLTIGNGAVSWAEQRVSSGMTSMLVGTLPLWIVLCEWTQGKRPKLLQTIGIVVGLVGVALLVFPIGASMDASQAPHASATTAGGETGATSGMLVDPLGAIALMCGSLSWAAGSLFARTATLAKPPAAAIAMQMLVGGTCMLACAALRGELATFDPARLTTLSVMSLLYLIVFGSLIGFSTYMWLIRVASPTAVGTYAYVNPVVAVLLGALLAGERVPPQALIAMPVIVGSVAIVSLAPQLSAWRERRGTRAERLDGLAES